MYSRHVRVSNYRHKCVLVILYGDCTIANRTAFTLPIFVTPILPCQNNLGLTWRRNPPDYSNVALINSLCTQPFNRDIPRNRSQLSMNKQTYCTEGMLASLRASSLSSDVKTKTWKLRDSQELIPIILPSACSTRLSTRRLVYIFATSNTGHGKILKWNSSEDTARNCVKF